MKEHTIRTDMKIVKGRLPLLAAVCLFGVSVICFCFYLNSSQKQAGRVLRELYTADDSWRLEADQEDALSDIYWEEFGSLMTAEGLKGARSLKLPYGLMEKGRRVVKTYAVIEELLPEETEQAGAGTKKAAAYSYRIRVELYYDKGDEVMQTVENELYAGTVGLKKTGFLKWQMDGLTGERIR